MSDSQNAKVNIERVYRPAEPFNVDPFDQSAVDYTKFADQITRVLESLESGAVVAIDAPWGSGKSYFAENFKERLNRGGWKTAYIDAFASDYLEDPFLLLASAVQTLASDAPTKRGFVAAAGHVGKALLPITAKAIVKVATAGALDLDEAEKTIVEAAGAAAEKVVEGRIREFEKERKSFATFRKRLNELAAKTNSDTGRPLVLFIDELDRCRPDFAVKTLERIKHLFDVPRVSFVLLLHTEQLQYAVEGVYGSIDSVAYLRKFIHFTLPLPKTENQVGRRPEVEAYIDYLAKRVSLHDRQAAFTRFVGGLKEIAPRMDLAFRDVERVILDFVLRRDVGPRMYAILLDALSFVLPLKVKHPALFQRLLKRDKSALPVAKDLLDRLEGRGVSDRFTRLMLDIIESHVHGKPASKDAANRWDETKGILGPDVEHAFGLVATDDE